MKTQIRFSADKNGKPIAHYWGKAQRWLPISVDHAKLKLASGLAIRASAEAAS